MDREIDVEQKLREIERKYGGFANFELITLCNEKDQQIADLEAKIKESENFYKDLGFKDEKDARDYLLDCITQPKDLVEDVRKLKQQLAEKEKEIEKLNTIIEVKDETIKHYKNWLDELRFRERNINGLIEQLPNQNQTAIAVLKEVKKLFEEKYAYDVEESDFAVIYETDIDEIIDQQIRVLKGE